jgi:hypothetical protein
MGTHKNRFTPQLRDVAGLDLRDETMYFRGLFDLVWQIHELPGDHPIRDDAQRLLGET